MKNILSSLLLLLSLSSISQDIVHMGIHQNITSCVDSVSIVAFDSILTKRIDISDISESLISEDHTSEGFIVMLENGDIVNFYRMDPGYNGDHVGNNARIMKRISSDNGQTWQTPLLVYNDPAFDDRNIQGGLIGKDSIVLFFRKFNAPNWQQIGLFFIHSFDGGVSWTEPTQLSTHLTNCAFGTSKIIHIPDRGFILPVYRDYYVELRLSTDGFNWDSVIWIWDYRTTWQYRISEASFAYTGNGHIVGIMRNDRVGLGQNYFMVYSSDYGYTWTNPQNTNLAYPYTCPAPLMFYDEDHDDIWTIVTDRRSNISGLTADVESIWIYRNKIDEIANNPQGFNLVKTLDRPLPSNFRMYGYPAQQKLNTNEYLIVFTESFLKENGKEACVKYQFNLKYDSVILAIETFAWNNGANSSSITVYDSGNYDVIMTDQDGNVYIESMQIYIDNYPVNIYSGDTIFVSDIAMLDAGNTGKQYLWSTGDTTQIITVYIQDWYYVTITNSCDNFAVDSVYVIFDIVGNDEDTYPFEISVYPNPASEFLYIELPYGINDAFISIWSYSGELLQKQEYNGQHINISHLPIGMYLIEIETDEMIFREKFIKEDY